MSQRVFDLTNFPTIKSERLQLREILPRDVTVLLQHFGNTSVIQYINNNPIKTIDQANEWLKWMGGFFAAKDGLRWSAELSESKTFIGAGGLYRWNREANYAELGFDIVPSYSGNGYATELAQTIIEFGWDTMKLNRIEAFVIVGNHASVRILTKLGFRKEGLLRQRVLKGGKYFDIYLFSLLESDYQERQTL